MGILIHAKIIIIMTSLKANHFKGFTLTKFFLIALVILCAVIASYYATSYYVSKQVYQKGYSKGYKNGYDIGFDKALTIGASEDPCYPFIIGGNNGKPYSLSYPTNCSVNQQSSSSNTQNLQSTQVNNSQNIRHCTSYTYGIYNQFTSTDCY